MVAGADMKKTNEHDQLTALGRSIVERSLYMVLATADAGGRPWATPVYFAPDGNRSFIWVSRQDARHSRNIGDRPELGITMFDSSAPISTGRAVYVAALGRDSRRPKDNLGDCRVSIG
jgi:nitroimidazol reductase NimA-like FMN-containing flavoprotein (pyridoxamine 5'-phosphate oxidase superfamily)